jgi:hypothetical protein
LNCSIFFVHEEVGIEHAKCERNRTTDKKRSSNNERYVALFLRQIGCRTSIDSRRNAADSAPIYFSASVPEYFGVAKVGNPRYYDPDSALRSHRGFHFLDGFRTDDGLTIEEKTNSHDRVSVPI